MMSTALTAAWAALHAFQYGYAISSLNGIQAPLTCGGALPGTEGFKPGLKPCVDMTVGLFPLHSLRQRGLSWLASISTN